MIQKLTPAQWLIALVALAIVLMLIGVVIKALTMLIWVGVAVAAGAAVMKYVVR